MHNMDNSFPPWQHKQKTTKKQIEATSFSTAFRGNWKCSKNHLLASFERSI